MNLSCCFICGCPDLAGSRAGYLRCYQCGHETLQESQSQGYIVNDPLSISDAECRTGLDKFKDAVLRHFDPEPPEDAIWVDVGSASGKYLYQNRSRYARSLGLEITRAAVEFSRNVLGLVIVEDIEELPKSIHVVTAWHSLEHFPANEVERLLRCLLACA